MRASIQLIFGRYPEGFIEKEKKLVGFSGNTAWIFLKGALNW
jgi:hypothetical protein